MRVRSVVGYQSWSKSINKEQEKARSPPMKRKVKTRARIELGKRQAAARLQIANKPTLQAIRKRCADTERDVWH